MACLANWESEGVLHRWERARCRDIYTISACTPLSSSSLSLLHHREVFRNFLRTVRFLKHSDCFMQIYSGCILTDKCLSYSTQSFLSYPVQTIFFLSFLSNHSPEMLACKSIWERNFFFSWTECCIIFTFDIFLFLMVLLLWGYLFSVSPYH